MKILKQWDSDILATKLFYCNHTQRLVALDGLSDMLCCWSLQGNDVVKSWEIGGLRPNYFRKTGLVFFQNDQFITTQLSGGIEIRSLSDGGIIEQINEQGQRHCRVSPIMHHQKNQLIVYNNTNRIIEFWDLDKKAIVHHFNLLNSVIEMTLFNNQLLILERNETGSFIASYDLEKNSYQSLVELSVEGAGLKVFAQDHFLAVIGGHPPFELELFEWPELDQFYELHTEHPEDCLVHRPLFNETCLNSQMIMGKDHQLLIPHEQGGLTSLNLDDLEAQRFSCGNQNIILGLVDIPERNQVVSSDGHGQFFLWQK